MSRTIMFMPINAKTGKPSPYDTEEFREQLTRYGIEVPDLEEGSQYYSMELPLAGGGHVEEEVMVLVEDDVVLGVSIDNPNSKSKTFWLQLIQMGYIMRYADETEWHVSPSWATDYQKAGSKAQGITQIKTVQTAADF